IGHITYAPVRYVGASERLKAFRRALERANIEVNEASVEFGDFSVESGYHAMRKILARRNRPTALFADNDTIAVGAISALHDAGISVSGGIGIAGFDDLPIAAYISPRLTTVATQAIAQGEQAALA